MKFIVNKKILRYLLLLCLLFISSALLILGTHIVFTNMSNQHTKNEATLTQRLIYLEQIDTALFKIESYVYATTAATNNPKERKELQNLILQENATIHQHLNDLQGQNDQLASIKHLEGAKCQNKVSKLSKQLHVNLEKLLRRVYLLNDLLLQRDTYIQQQDKKLQSVAKRIRKINKDMPQFLEKSHALIQDVSTYSQERMVIIKQVSKKAKKHYFLAEVILNILYAVGLISILYRIFQNIISLYQTLERQLTQDQLTKLPNRVSLLKNIEALDEPMLCILDIKQFHLINELYGTAAGNSVLTLLTRRLLYLTKDTPCTLYRISGDEFVFLYHKNDDTDTFAKIINTCIKTVEKEPLFIPSIQENVSVAFSCGIAKSTTNALGFADMALNRAKMHKSHPIAIYDAAIDSIDSLENTKKWKSSIEKGLKDDAFIPYFQPILDPQGTVIKHEALMRLCLEEDYQTTVVTPYHFLDLSKKMRTYHQVSQMMLLKSLDVVAKEKRSISLNLCYQDIVNKPLITALKQKITDTNIGSYLTFEIVESEDIENYEVIREFIEDIRKLGVRIALDDFGSGFSNFSYILSLSPDFIKIDGSLIKDIHQNKKSQELVKAICSFSKELGIKTVAEYVHNKEVFDVAKSIGIDYFQGYYFAEPAPLMKESL